ncbi:hypothetical protein [Chondrinema litorale]|uniref:hypothetical protein n=1 Tax=Chondrinema litorale TaxID=2994555 RepID=UPI002543ED6B|nr:hypothetical protein [Chondrinema litorale]UZR99852.1 hypothetical protein OQ292_38345 [Chondrinema litorale]
MNTINSKVIMFTRKEDVLASKYEDNYDNVISKNIQLLPNNKIEEFLKIHEVLGSQKISNNSILIAHPYKANCFVSIQNSNELLQREKLLNTANIAKILGAKSFEVKSIRIKETEKNYKIDANGKYKCISTTLKTEKNVDEKTHKNFSLKNYYIGSEPDYQKAKEKLYSYGLNIDPEISALVESRNPIDSNLLSQQEILLNTSSELNESLDIASNLMLLSNMVEIGVSFKSKIHIRESVELSIKITF